jgi:hypothetical protein
LIRGRQATSDHSTDAALKGSKQRKARDLIQVLVAPLIEEQVLAMRMRAEVIDEFTRSSQADDVQIDADADLRKTATEFFVVSENRRRLLSVCAGEGGEQQSLLRIHVTLELGLEARPELGELLTSAALERVERLLEEIFESAVVGKKSVSNGLRGCDRLRVHIGFLSNRRALPIFSAFMKCAFLAAQTMRRRALFARERV